MWTVPNWFIFCVWGTRSVLIFAPLQTADFTSAWAPAARVCECRLCFSPWCGWRPPAPASCGCSWTAFYLTAAGWSPGSWLRRWSHQSGPPGRTVLGLQTGGSGWLTLSYTTQYSVQWIIATWHNGLSWTILLEVRIDMRKLCFGKPNDEFL